MRAARVVAACALLATALTLAMACASAGAATGYGELLRFKGKGTKAGDPGSEFVFAGEEAHAFALSGESDRLYVGSESDLESEKLRVQSYDTAGAFEGEALIKPPSPPKGIEGFETYEGFALDGKEKRVYALVVFRRQAEADIDPSDGVAGALYALKSVPSAAGKLEPAEGAGKEGLLGTTESLAGNSEVPGKALLEPSGITVDPLTGEVLILGLVDEGSGALHVAVEHVSPTGAVLYTWVDPQVSSLLNEPDSPVVSEGGTLFYEAGDELLALPADAHSGEPSVAFEFAQGANLESEPFSEQLTSFGEGETSFGGGLAIVAEGAGSGRLVASAEIDEMTETGTVGEWRNGALNLAYSEEAGSVSVSELGWAGGVPGEGADEKAKPCEIGFAYANPLMGAAPGGDDYVLAPAFAEVLELGPGGSGCLPAKEAPGGLEATIDGKRVSNPEITDPVTLSARVVQASILSVQWIFGDGEQATVLTPAGEQTQLAEVTHKFAKAGKLTVEAVVHTDDLATPELRLKTTVNVIEVTSGSPKVTKDPTAKSVLEGENVSFEAAASGEPKPSVQWEVSTDRGEAWSQLAGQTSATLTLAAVTVADSGNEYRATFSNGVGTPVSTTAATLTVESLAAHEEKARREEAEAKQRAAEETQRQREEEERRKSSESNNSSSSNNSGSSSNTGSQQQSTTAQQGVQAFREAAADATLASSSTLTATPSGSLTLKVRCPSGVSACTGTVTLRTLTALATRKGAKKAILTLAQGSFTIAGGEVKALALHLSATARRMLAGGRTLRARLVINAHNGKGEAQTVQDTVSVRLHGR